MRVPDGDDDAVAQSADPYLMAQFVERCGPSGYQPAQGQDYYGAAHGPSLGYPAAAGGPGRQRWVIAALVVIVLLAIAAAIVIAAAH